MTEPLLQCQARRRADGRPCGARFTEAAARRPWMGRNRGRRVCPHCAAPIQCAVYIDPLTFAPLLPYADDAAWWLAQEAA